MGHPVEAARVSRVREADREWLEPEGGSDAGPRRARVIGGEPDLATPGDAGTDDWEPTVAGSWETCPCGGTGKLIVNAGQVVPCPKHGRRP